MHSERIQMLLTPAAMASNVMWVQDGGQVPSRLKSSFEAEHMERYLPAGQQLAFNRPSFSRSIQGLLSLHSKPFMPLLKRQQYIYF